MSKANAVFDNQRGGFRPPMGSGMGVGEPSPNDCNDRFDGSMGPGMGMGSPMGIGFNRGRGGRNLKGSHYISKTGHSVHVRGMPFLAIEKDVFDFFAPIQPVRVKFEYGSDGRRTGKANVDFATHQEALEAMKKHRSNMQHRYIELFLNSTPTREGFDMGNYGSDMDGGFSIYPRKP